MNAILNNPIPVRFKWIAVLALGVALPSAFPPQQAAAEGNIAVIDVAKIFKQHPRFKRLMEDMKKDVEAAEARIRTERKAIADMVKGLEQYQPGTPQFKQKEELAAKRQSDLQLRVNLEKKDFLEQEAKIYKQVYDEVVIHVQNFARRHRIVLVLRYNSEQMTQKRQDVLVGVNRPVVFQDNIDITGDIQTEIMKHTRPQPNARPYVPGPSLGFSPGV